MRISRSVGLVILVLCVSAMGVAQMDGLGPSATSVSAAAYYYISKSGEITMPLNLWGQVKNPGRYEVPISADLVTLISFAGGPLGDAKMSAVKVTRIERIDNDIKKVEFTLNLERLDRLDSQTLSLRPGDTIYIERIPFGWPDFINLITAASTVAIAVASVISLSN
jgi:hypothetical protein